MLYVKKHIALLLMAITMTPTLVGVGHIVLVHQEHNNDSKSTTEKQVHQLEDHCCDLLQFHQTISDDVLGFCYQLIRPRTAQEENVLKLREIALVASPLPPSRGPPAYQLL